MNDFARILEDFFVKYLSVERGCSINTRKNYRDTFVELFAFLNETLDIPSNKICMETFSFDTINSFLDWLEETKGVSVATRNNRLAGIKSFFKYVSYKEPYRLNLCSSILDIKAKKNISAPMNYLTIAAIEQLFASFDLKDPDELRDFCIIALLYESGARVSELIYIKLCEIRLDMPSTVVLHGKGGKSRIVPIDRTLAAKIRRYVSLFKKEPDDYLFTNAQKKPLSRRGVDYILQKHFKEVRSVRVRENDVLQMIEDAKSFYPVPHSVFDRNTDLFNCQNGTLNLTTGEFRFHDPADFLTLMSGITYDPEASCPRWTQFISEVMCNDADLALYLQKALGYALTGDTSLEYLFILYGATSRNGKGTTMETFLRIMGDYGKTSNPEMLSTKFGNTNASGPSEEIARLAGVRFVNISEPEKKITFNAALVKRMTGNDTLNARFLHENSFDFKPNFKIFINTNYKPSVSDMTLFYSNRLKLIPFKRHFEEHEQDKGLKNFFAESANLSAIFNWCYEGYRHFRATDLADSAAVVSATKEYQEESDRIGQFVDAWLEEGEAYEVRTSAAYKLYGEWCDKYGYRKENSTNFNNAIQRFFRIERKRPNGETGGPTTMLIGCRFLEHENGEAEEETAAFS